MPQLKHYTTFLPFQTKLVLSPHAERDAGRLGRAPGVKLKASITLIKAPKFPLLSQGVHMLHVGISCTLSRVV